MHPPVGDGHGVECMQEAILTASRNHLDDVMGRASFMPGADERDRRFPGLPRVF